MGMGNVGRVVPAGSVDVPRDFWNRPEARVQRPQPGWLERHTGWVWIGSCALTWAIIGLIGYFVEMLCRAVFGVLTNLLSLPR